MTSDKFDESAALSAAKNGDSEAISQIIKKYSSRASAMARKYFIVGADVEDLEQEALIALFAAIASYDASRSDSFDAFASMCMKNRLISYVRSANRRKHIPLNSFVSLDDIEIASEDLMQKVIDTETLEEYRKQIGVKLTKREKTILGYYLSGCSYTAIAEACGISRKAVDNVIYRVKKKLNNNA